MDCNTDTESEDQPPPRDLTERTTAFAIDAIKLTRFLPNDPTVWDSKRQLGRSATSVGANYREAKRARTKAEFVSKLQIALGEADESKYWIEVLIGVFPEHEEEAGPLLKEETELTAILVAAVRTTKQNQES